MQKTTLTFVLLFTLSLAFSQTQIKQFVYFDHDQSAITDGELEKLNQFKSDLKKHSDFEIKLVGHTDQDGDSSYNQALAQKRAEAVKDFLTNEDIFQEQINVSWRGENELVSHKNTTSAKQLNRRVEIIATTYDYEDAQDLISSVHEVGMQEFKHSNSAPISFECENGTQISVEAEAFEYADGSGTVKEDITFEVKEALTYEDFIAEGLFTHSKGEILETGGMMYINATAGGKEIKLREGQDMEVIYPLQNTKEGMELFYASSDSEGNLDWSPTNEAIGTVNSGPDSGLELQPTDLKNILNFNIAVPEKPELIFETLRKKPRVDDQPFPPAEPKKGYPSEYTKYDQKYKNYEQALVEYKINKPKQEKDLASWNEEVDNRFTAIIEYKKNMRMFHAKAQAKGELLKIARLSETNNEAQVLRVLKSFINKPLNLEINDRKLHVKAFENQAYHILRSRGIFRQPKPTDFLKTLNILEPELKNLINDALTNAALIAYEKTGEINQEGVSQYITKVNRLGWINCDRFPDWEIKTDIYFSENDKNAQYFLVFKDIKSLLRPSRDNDGFVFRNIPEKEDCKIIAVKIVDKKPMISFMDYKIQKDDNLSLDFKPGSLVQIKDELKKLDTGTSE